MDGFEYDYQSIMHYTNKAFGKVDETTGEQLITMVPKQVNIKILKKDSKRNKIFTTKWTQDISLTFKST